MSESTSPWTEITRYLSGEASADERFALEQWASAHPDHRILFDQVQKLWIGRPPAISTPSLEIDQQIARLTARIETVVSPVVAELETEKPRTTHRYGWLVGAAAAAVVLTLMWNFPESGPKRTEQNTRIVSASGEYKVYTTRPGQRAIVELSDGTRVSMNAGSTLEIPRDFGISTRRLRLVGHAIFEIRHHTGTPFIVDAPGAQTTFLGTEFSVYAYSSNVRVAVRSGRVSVGACGTSDEANASSSHGATASTFGTPHPSSEWCGSYLRQVIVNANEGAEVSSAGRVSLNTQVPLSRDFSFVSGYLMLDDTPLGDRIDDLNRWYDVDIRLSTPSLRTLRLGGWLSEGSIDDFIEYLTRTLPVRVHRDGRTITISP